CIISALQNFRGIFGFNPELLRTLKLKTALTPESERHGGLVLDEVKLSEHLTVAASGHLQVFVDLDKFTPPELRTVPADRERLLVFQPFMRDRVFASRGTVKGHLLSKIITEAIILCEEAALFVDYLFCDGASWNINMWHSFGIEA
ncbi:hypothetical protein HPB47_014775, partial [Ixodes persulcatus]